MDPEMTRAVAVSLRVSTTALLLATVIGLPIGALLAIKRFPGRTTLRVSFRALMSVPTVVIGLVLFGILSRRGPLGDLQLLFTPTAMALGQAVLVLPIVICLVDAALEASDPQIRKTALTLGASPIRATWEVLRETRFALAAALAAAFGRAFSEVGISMMLGGNIRGATRNITTGIALETGKGEFALGLALGVILLLVALGINTSVQLLQRWGRPCKS